MVPIKRNRGRPPLFKTDDSLSHRLQVMLSKNDQARLKEIQKWTSASSFSEVIRNAVQKEYDYQCLVKNGVEVD